jgi:hypothetical protein
MSKSWLEPMPGGYFYAGEPDRVVATQNRETAIFQTIAEANAWLNLDEPHTVKYVWPDLQP